MQRRGHTDRAHCRPAGPSETFGNFLIRIESASHFSDFSNFLEGCLPPEDGSDRAENLTRSISDKVAKKIFLAQTKNQGVTFRAFCSSTVLTFGLFAVRAF